MSEGGPTDLSAATRRALGFLLSSQEAGGAWKDFLLPAGNSNVWVTAFVAGVLAELGEPEARRAALDGWRFLETVTTADGGWSYNPSVPGDADSTLWGLRLAEALGAEGSETFRRASRFLERHAGAGGGLATYASADTIRQYIGLPPFVSFAGWTQPHVCVTAAGANLSAHRQSLRQYLLSRQTDAGNWDAYWWFDDEFATAEAVSALAGEAGTAAGAAPEIAARVERAAAWALGRCEILTAAAGTRPPAFALAHVLRILVRAGRSPEVLEAVRQAAARLAEWQAPDGSWPSSARLRVPRPDAVVPDAGAEWTMWAGVPAVAPSFENVLKHTFNNYSPDHYRIYTTATVLRALHETSLRSGRDATEVLE